MVADADGPNIRPHLARRLRDTAEARVARIPTAVAGVLLVVAAGASFTAMHTTIKFVAGTVHPFEVAFFRNLFGFAVLVPYLVSAGRAALYTRRPGLHAVRGAFNGVSMLCWFYALSLIPVADATALSLSGPLFVVFGAILFMGEPGSFRRWSGIALGFAGALVIIRPGFVDPSLGVVLVLVSSAAVAVSKLIAKVLLRTETTASVVAWVTCIMMLVAAVPTAFVWTTPTLLELALLALIGTLGTVAHLLLTRAYKIADVTVAEAVLFTHLLWAALFGFVVFGHFPDIWTWIGSGLIVAASTWIVGRDRRLPRTS
ncbi:MAG: DMT family transporter [Alphaproteobacteria bacterium]